jgi:cytochrome P450
MERRLRVSDSEDMSSFCHHDAERMQDPFAFYAHARSRCPVARSDELDGFYYTLDHASAKQVLSDYSHFTSTQGVALPAMPSKMLPVDLDPPRQTRFRKTLNRFFSVEAAEQRRDAVQGVVDDLVDAFIADGQADLAAQLTRPTVTHFMLPLIGVPAEDRARLTREFDFLSNERTTDPEQFDRTVGYINGYLMSLIARRRAEAGPQDDYIQYLLDEPFEGQMLDDQGIFEVLLVTLFGALDTTHAASNTGLLHLGRNPGDKQRLLSGEVAWATAIEEFVRYASPIHFLRRTAKQDIELSGVAVPDDTPILASIGAANRDPARFEEPERCIISRDARDHLGFGAGAHVCLGRNFARVIIQTVLTTVLTRLPDYRVPEDFTPVFTAGEGRRMKSLPVSFTPGLPLANAIGAGR